MIELEAVSKRYGAQIVLESASFSVDTGKVAAIIGVNGCGKSTLLAIMSAMLKPDGGRVLLDGEDPFRKPRVRSRIGYLAQGDCLFDELTVRDNLAFWAAAAGGSSRKASGNPYIGLMGLESLLGKRVSRLSGGMRRRAAICAALMSDPDYLMLDEPFAGLDIVYRQELIEYLLRLRDMGKTLIYSTHSPEDLLSLSDTAVLLTQGQVQSIPNASGLIRHGIDMQKLFVSLIKGETRL